MISRPLFTRRRTPQDRLKALWRYLWPRRLLLVALVAATLAAGGFLTGCATHPGEFSAGGHQWVPTDRKKCTSYTWHVRTVDEMRRACSVPNARGCAFSDGCYVLSLVSEAEARKIDLWGMSLFEHEVEMHLYRGLAHPW